MSSDVDQRADDARTLSSHPAAARRWVWQPNLIVFVSSACIMVLELVAGRIIAPHVGSSLYTWTSVIGVVLAGISLGNYVGGRLADRRASLRLLGVIYCLAAVTSLIVLWLDRTYRITPSDWPLLAEIVVLTIGLFFLPCAILGMISPIVAKLAVSSLAKSGSTIGNIYAAGALGSIVGTFATGFVLISSFGTYTIIWGVAAVLAAMGLFFFFGGRWFALGLTALIVLGGSTYAVNQKWLLSPCTRETNYYCIKVYDEEHEGVQMHVLVLDHLVHSYVSPTDPQRLIYEYEKVYAESAAYEAQRTPQLRALMIGGGGYTFPRYIDFMYPGSQVHVVEIDPGVTQAAYDLLGLKRDTHIMTFNEDARMYLERTPSSTYNLIMGDAFNHYSVPYHLTTKEFNDRVHAWLAKDGLYVVNIIDGPHGDFLRSYYNTLRQSFEHVYLIGNPGWRDTLRTTFVLISTDTPIDMDAMAKVDVGMGDPVTPRLLASDSDITRLLTEAPVAVLTDQYAPVDQLLAPVSREEGPK